jgi:hypothetical protein
MHDGRAKTKGCQDPVQGYLEEALKSSQNQEVNQARREVTPAIQNCLMSIL